MEQKERLSFCKKCKNRQFDPNRGIVCGLTQQKADFDNGCVNFIQDPASVDDFSLAEKADVAEQEVVSISEEILENLKRYQNFGYALVGGMLAVLISAVLWALVTVSIKYQIGYMAIGVGFLVGFAVRFFGIGFERKFGILGGFLALLGCLLGNLFGYVGLSAEQMGN